MSKLIPVSEPLFGKREEELVLDCLRTGWISSEGRYVKEFEKMCASYCSVKEGIAVSNGTAALQVALKCLPLNKGDEVILPSFTIISCVIAVLEAGAVPVLVDCDPETWTMKVADIASKITSRTKAIMAVHIYGHSVDMDPVLQVAKDYNLFIIEDNAECHGGDYKGRKCGGISDISILSFYANKLVTTGEGGMVLTSNPKFAERARALRNMCFKPDIRFLHTEIGHNYRMTNIQAAIGIAQLERLEQFVERKREVAQIYNEELKGLPVQLPVEKEWAKNIYWMYALVLDDSVKVDAKKFAGLLMEKNIQTRPFFLGMHEQPVLKDLGLFRGESYPVCERISRRGFYLPSGQAITEQQIMYTCKAMHDVFEIL